MIGQPVMLLRMHRIDESATDYFVGIANQCGFHLVIVADNRSFRPSPRHKIDQINVSPEIYKEMGLYCERDVMWRCGDYALYAARKALPEKEFYWLIEPDVYIHAGNIKHFFKNLEKSYEYDFVASRMYASDSSWAWHAAIAQYYARPHQCLFSFLGCSSQAVDYAFKERCRIGALFQEAQREPDQRWPNDESFFASTLAAGGFACADLNDLGRRCYSRTTFKLNPPFSRRVVQAGPFDDLIYHPVLAGAYLADKYNKRLDEELHKRTNPKEIRNIFGAPAIEALRFECGDTVASIFINRLDNLQD